MNDPQLETLLVIAKEPLPGRVKTRLVPAVTHEQAADIARAALEDTLAAGSALPVRNRILVLDGRPGSWLPADWRCVRQVSGSLDARLAAAFSTAGCGPTLLIGMDTPHIGLAQLSAFDPSRFDAGLGEAPDGGFWAIGLTDPARAAEVIPGVPMSTPRTGIEQARRLRAAGLRVQPLGTFEDVDDIRTALRVAHAYPNGAFARAVRAAA